MHLIRYIVILLLPLSVFSQTPAYLHYTLQDGLPSNLIYCGLQDQHGLIWVGTDKGLACFDGIRFRVYGVADGLPDPEVLSIREDSKGRLWIFCFRKKPCYIFNGRIVTEKEDTRLTDLILDASYYNVIDDTAGGIWITGHSRRLYRLDKDSLYTQKTNATVVGIVYKGSKSYYLTQKHIVSMEPGTTDTLLIFKNAQDQLHSTFTGMGHSGNSVLMAFSDRVILLQWRGDKFLPVEEKHMPWGSVSKGNDGHFLHSSSDGGTVCFENPDQTLDNPVYYLSDQSITYAFEDKQGTKWFCTSNNGLFALPKNAPLKFLADDNSVSKNIRSLAHTSNGIILAGDDRGTVHMLKGAKQESIKLKSSRDFKQVRQIIEDADHVFWAATDDGVYKHDLVTNRNETLMSEGAIKSIAKTPEYIWVGFHDGIARIERKDNQIIKLYKGRTTAVLVDDQQNLWVGIINGFLSLADSFQTNWGEVFPELKSRIVAIANAGKDKLWVVTPELGLLLVKTNQGKVLAVETINARLKTPISNIQSLFADERGRIWMATNSGVYGIDRQWNVTRFSVHDGLVDNDVNAVMVYRDTLWAATAAGLSCIQLRTITEEPEFKTLLVNLRYQQQRQVYEQHLLDSFNVNRRLFLPASASNIELDLAGLDFRSRGNLDFELVQTTKPLPWKWWTFQNLLTSISGKRDTVLVESGTYFLGSYLPPGYYNIKATAINTSGVHSTLPDQWDLIKIPIWYETIWFYLTILIVVAYGIWRVYRARAAYREIHANAAVLQLQALQAQMNPHFTGNAVNAIQQFMHPPNPEKTSEYISMFIGLLRRTMYFSEQTFIPFEEELKYDQDYLRLVLLRFENRFEYEIIGIENIPPSTPVPSMFLQPIMENATMHGIAPEGISRLRMEFAIVGDQFRCVLTDNGIGLLESQRQKRLIYSDRESKGISMLQKKVKSLNQLYNLEMSLLIQDRSELQHKEPGTCATLCYSLEKIWKANEKLTKTTSSKGR